MKTIDFSYFIERYNAGEMSDTEYSWFRKELESNENLRNEVKLRKRADEILKQQDIISLRNKLNDIEKRRAAGVPGTVKKPFHFNYAAAIAVLVLIAILFVLPGRKYNSEDIMNRYYKTYEPTTGQRSLQTKTNDDFSQALEYYNSHDYKNAAVYFSKVVESSPKDMYAVLLNGISNFEDSQYPEAKQSFGKVIADNKSLYVDQAQWYLALCYMKTNETDKAVELFGKIEKESGFYAKDAKKIIRKLN
jgi:TolA-binding protein